jgi:hypothetical protein
LDQNVKNLILLQHELNAHWLLIVEDLRKLLGNQTVLQSQIEARAMASREAEANAIGYQELHDKITNFLQDIPNPEE